ncbi:anthocyanidin 3-O-glucosyltransferase 2-like [Mangifera indica]|uniref:anthocyanidin 3-O-glucosyltransferase 2-like n=1 Tax=Mangifera indica TaxID=29780 RepID=UPI001CF9328C|nr:anthocyanidin 3-O-glucosyltransferase 2-like [Mangifera indica]
MCTCIDLSLSQQPLNKMKKAELVFIPPPVPGHLVPLIEFAKGLFDRNDHFSVTVLLIQFPTITSLVAEYTKSFAESNVPIRLINLPPPVHFCPSQEPYKSIEKFVTELVDYHKACIKEAIVKHVVSNENSAQLAGLVVDIFSTSMIDVANELGVPSYLFFTSCAAFLGLLMFLPTRHAEIGREFEEFDGEAVIPCYVNPVPSSGMPEVLLSKYGGYTTFLNHGRRVKETGGIIVNTFEELESHAVKCLMNDFDNVPPVYTVGPLIDLKDESNKLDSDVIMKWLDDQPDSSVVFLCFGSMGSFGKDQAKEIAFGLEQSGVRFLWSFRKSPRKDKLEAPSDYNSDVLQEILPNGFLERTKKIGLVCGWAPQKAVLAHKSVGAFVSHCGWNSILESLWFGVPIVTWPLYAEQQLNALQLVKDLGLAVELRLDYKISKGELVNADEIERAIKCAMDGKNDVRKRFKEKSEMSRLAVMEGGSSYAAFGGLIENIARNKAMKEE